MMQPRYVTPALLVLAALVLAFWFAGTESPQTPTADTVSDDPAAKAAAQSRAEFARIRAEQQALLDQAMRAKTKVESDLPAEHSRWQAEVDSLLDNDQGRALAANDAYLAAFAREYDNPRPSPEIAASLDRQLAFLLPPLQEASADPKSLFLPDKEFQAKLNDVTRQADEALSAYRAHREAIERLVRVASKDHHPAAGGPTLRTALQARKDNAEAERLRAEQAQLEAQHREDAERVAREAEDERQRNVAEEETRRQLADAEAARRVDILQKASDPAFQRAFSPFLIRAEGRIGRGTYPYGSHPGAFTDIERAGGFQNQRRLKSLLRYPGQGRHGVEDWEAGVQRFSDLEAVARVWVDQCKLLYSPADAGKPCTPKVP